MFKVYVEPWLNWFWNVSK